MKRTALALIILLMIASCGKAGEEKRAEVPRSTASCPYTVRLIPENATRKNTISVYVRGANPKDLRYRWFVNDIEVTEVRGMVLRYSGLKKHDMVRVEVTGENGTECLSDPLIIANTPPKVHAARLMPATPRTGDDISVETRTLDEDGDDVAVDYKWAVNGENVPAGLLDDPGVLPGDLVKRGDRITVMITPDDGETRGQTITLESIVVNSPPEVSKDIEAEFNGSLYTARINALDPDGDRITYRLVQAPDGMTINPETGVITWLVTSDDEGEHDITVVVDDGHGGEIILPFTTTIGLSGYAE